MASCSDCACKDAIRDFMVRISTISWFKAAWVRRTKKVNLCSEPRVQIRDRKSK